MMEPEQRGKPGEPGEPGESGDNGGAGGTGGRGGRGGDAPPVLPASVLQRSLWLVAVSNVVMFLVVVGLAVFVWMNAQSNRNALCSFKGDLQGRVANTQEYIDAHNEPGEPEPLLPLATLQNQLKNQQATVDSLSGLSCD